MIRLGIRMHAIKLWLSRRAKPIIQNMASNTIEDLLKAANSSPDGDTSVNVAKRTFLDEEKCVAFFEDVRSRMVRIDEWNKNSSATGYELFDETGEKAADGSIEVDRFIRINVYGSGKYDWVRVVSIVDDPLEFVLEVKPSYDPTEDPVETSKISHFFGPEATNNFCLQRDEKTLAFCIIGLNEKQNTEFTQSLIESARNAAIANVGYYSGLQKAVWKDFGTNFLKTDEEKED